MHDIESFPDVKLLVDTFYQKVQENTLLGPVFNDRIGDKWPEHLEKMYRFWQTALLEETTYFGSPFPPHATMSIGKPHFDEWLQLFEKTIDGLFDGPKADEAKWRAGKMAVMFLSKIDYYKSRNSEPLA